MTLTNAKLAWLAAICLGASAVSAAAKPKAAPAAAPAKTAQEIAQCMADNAEARSGLRDVAIAVFDKDGPSRKLRVRLFWKPTPAGGTRLNLRMLEPPDLAGSSYLLLVENGQEEVHFYLPSAKTAKRITGQDMTAPLWGSDFSYGEIKQVMGLLASGETRSVGETKVLGRKAWKLETATSKVESGYQKVRSYVDQSNCVLLKAEFLDEDNKSKKVMVGDVGTLTKNDKYSAILRYTMSNLVKGTHTQLTMTDLLVDNNVWDRLFSPTEFYAANPEQDPPEPAVKPALK